MKLHLIGHKVFFIKSWYHLKWGPNWESEASNYVSLLFTQDRICLRFATFWRAHTPLNKWGSDYVKYSDVLSLEFILEHMNLFYL